jgi:2-polyprenyl-3-methyl-5-hydroxy-6-metoxy-1,4-benzoquinol methylase
MIYKQIIPKCPKAFCLICSSKGTRLYHGLRDHLFGAPDKWNISKCNDPKCGLLWVDPQPEQSSLSKLYQNYYTHTPSMSLDATKLNHSLLKQLYTKVEDAYLARKFGYVTESSHWVFRLASRLMVFFPVRKAVAEFKIMNLPFMEQGKLLEIGCGSGTGLEYLSSKSWQVEGLDFDPEAVTQAKNKGLNVSAGELADQQYDANSLDAIIMSHVIEHVIDPNALLQECLRILKPKGYCVMATPNSHSFGHNYYKQNWRGLELPRHLHIFNLKNLQEICAQVGFTKVEANSTLRDTLGMFRASQRLKKNISPENALSFGDIITIHFLTLYERCLLLPGFK